MKLVSIEDLAISIIDTLSVKQDTSPELVAFLSQYLMVIFDESIWCSRDVGWKQSDQSIEVLIPGKRMMLGQNLADMEKTPYLYDWHGHVYRMNVECWLKEEDCLQITERKGFFCLQSKQSEGVYRLAGEQDLQQEVTTSGSVSWVVVQPVYIQTPYGLYPALQYVPGHYSTPAAPMTFPVTENTVMGMTQEEAKAADYRSVICSGASNPPGESLAEEFPALGSEAFNKAIAVKRVKRIRPRRRKQYQYASMSLTDFCRYLEQAEKQSGEKKLHPLVVKKQNKEDIALARVRETCRVFTDDADNTGSDPAGDNPDFTGMVRLQPKPLTMAMLEEEHARPYWYNWSKESGSNLEPAGSGLRRRVAQHLPVSSVQGSSLATRNVSKRKKVNQERAGIFTSLGYSYRSLSQVTQEEVEQSKLPEKTDHSTDAEKAGDVSEHTKEITLPAVGSECIEIIQEYEDETTGIEHIELPAEDNGKPGASLIKSQTGSENTGPLIRPELSEWLDRQRYPIDPGSGMSTGCLMSWLRYSRTWLPCRSGGALAQSLHDFNAEAVSLLKSRPELDYEIVWLKLCLNTFVCLDGFALHLNSGAKDTIVQTILETDAALLEQIGAGRRQRAQLALFIANRFFRVTDTLRLHNATQKTAVEFRFCYCIEAKYQKQKSKHHIHSLAKITNVPQKNQLAYAECVAGKGSQITRQSRTNIIAALDTLQFHALWNYHLQGWMADEDLKLTPEDLIGMVYLPEGVTAWYPLYHELIAAVDSELRSLASMVDRIHYDTALNYAACRSARFEELSLTYIQTMTLHCMTASFLFRKYLMLFFRPKPLDEFRILNCDINCGYLIKFNCEQNIILKAWTQEVQRDPKPFSLELSRDDWAMHFFIERMIHFRRVRIPVSGVRGS
ncbi:hypothetical protein [Spongorhabdus nitratireducens]